MKVYICFEKLKSYSGDEGEVVKVVATKELAKKWLSAPWPSNVDWRGWEEYEVGQWSVEEDDECVDEDYSCPHCSGTGEGMYGDTSCPYCKGRGY